MDTEKNGGADMKEGPILFGGEMVRAILEGRKTQTRRIVKPHPQLLNGTFKFTDEECGKETWPEPNVWLALTPSGKFGLNHPPYYKCPYGKTGDRLWIKEPFRITGFDEANNDVAGIYSRDGEQFNRPLTDREFEKFLKWKKRFGGKSSLYMFKSLARHWLENVSVRVERLQEITVADIIAEGVQVPCTPDRKPLLQLTGNPSPCDYLKKPMPASGYSLDELSVAYWCALWDSINGKPRKDGVDISWAANPWVWVVEFRKLED